MTIHAERFTDQERRDLARLASRLAFIAQHPLTTQLALLLESWAKAKETRQFSTNALDASAELMYQAWEQMNSGQKGVFKNEFHAACECRAAARTVGQGGLPIFSESVALALDVLKAAA